MQNIIEFWILFTSDYFDVMIWVEAVRKNFYLSMFYNISQSLCINKSMASSYSLTSRLKADEEDRGFFVLICSF